MRLVLFCLDNIIRNEVRVMLEKLKQEILDDQANNRFKSAYQMPLEDKHDVSRELRARYKEAARELTADDSFPYEVECWMQGDILRIGYKTLS